MYMYMYMYARAVGLVWRTVNSRVRPRIESEFHIRISVFQRRSADSNLKFTLSKSTFKIKVPFRNDVIEFEFEIRIPAAPARAATAVDGDGERASPQTANTAVR